MGRRLLSCLSLLLSLLAADASFALPSGDFVRNADGSIKGRLTYYDAKAECERLGRRLPTMFELAQIATQFGAVIVTEQDVRNENLPKGYKSRDLGPFCPISRSGATQFLQSEPPERQRRAV